MPALPEGDRVNVWAEFMADISSVREAISLTKTEMRAAVDAVDDWAVANQASFNTALPLPARTELTAAQKAQLLSYVLRRRYVTGV